MRDDIAQLALKIKQHVREEGYSTETCLLTSSLFRSRPKLQWLAQKSPYCRLPLKST